ncbi:MAG TPA: alternative ribosome rescue aminoacyl-tRNA hydrolase ArfB [Rhizomicrobium sp.]|nr:alternative ribosome rescue aminoacyl-tRNA hydrolase ArfB [Rhizomicrobium sp.]
MTALRITPSIRIDESELEESFILSSGAGGQNVNKVASAVQLRFDVVRSLSLPDPVRLRLIALSGSRLTKDGVLVLVGRQFRDQARNRIDVRERLAELIRAAAVIPKKRRPTKPTRASKEKRLDSKKKHARLKQTRSKNLE